MPPTPAQLRNDAAAALGRDPRAAERLARDLLAALPGDAAGSLLLASALRRQQRHGEARRILEPLAAAHPSAALTHYELGVVRSACGEPDLAAEALRRALTLAPAHAESLRALTELELGRGRFREAERLAEQAISRGGEHPWAVFALAAARFRQQRPATALPLVEALIARAPTNPAYRNLYAACLGGLGRDPEALAIYEALLEEAPGQVDVQLNYAQALRTVGRRDEAIAAYRAVLAASPACGEAYWQLANLKVGALRDADVASLERLSADSSVPDVDRVRVGFALGKALEDRGETTRAFAAYAAGAARQARIAPYDPCELARFVERARELLTRGAFRACTRDLPGSEAPIFVVGLPRSGSTLVEQILASHSQVEGTMELPDIGLLARHLAEQGGGGSYLDRLVGLGTDELDALGRSYLGSTAVYRRLNRPRFVDKMPNNFLHVALIGMALPQARIIDVRRHPMAAGFSVFKQHFAHGQRFSYRLEHIGAYYGDYLALMRHYDKVLPGRIHRVVYEDLVADTETEVRRLLAHCGLEFEPGCLDFHRSDRPVRTVSSEQVRQPIFTSALEQWRAFEPWLGPLKRSLGPALEKWRD